MTLLPPAGAPAITLHARAGEGQDDIRRVFDVSTTPALEQLLNKTLSGTWTLRVKDSGVDDVGAILSFAVELVV